MKPFLILQIRPTAEVADDEFEKFLKYGNIGRDEVRRIRMEQGNLPKIKAEDYSGIIVGGGPDCASTAEEKKSEAQAVYDVWLQALLKEIVEKDIPYLGCCYGLGSLSLNQGGCVSKEKYSEPVHGVEVSLTEEGKQDVLLQDLPETFRVLVGHKEACQDVPDTAVHLVRGDVCPVQMIRVGKNVYATQFHPESDPESFILRINIYKHAGYFPPEDAQKLIDKVKDETNEIPQEILRRFVERYRQE